MWMPHKPGFERRQHVGFHRVADHHRLPSACDTLACDHAAIGVGVLFADDRYREGMLAEARARQLLLLVQDVALGHHDQLVTRSFRARRGSRRRRAEARPDAPAWRAPSPGSARWSPPARRRAVRSIAVSIIERREALHAIAVELEVPDLDLEQARLHMVGIAVILQQIDKPILGQVKDRISLCQSVSSASRATVEVVMALLLLFSSSFPRLPSSSGA